MDIEQLTKAQIILLAVLVSFVTAIATGIATVTLLDQAPPVVTKTINQVVERTVERVVPSESQGATVVEKETTVVVKEEDLITESIQQNSDRIVRLVLPSQNSNAGNTEEGQNQNEGGTDAPVALGTIVSPGGLVVTTKAVTPANVESVTATTLDGRSFKVQLVNTDEEYPTTLLTLLRGEGDAEPFSPVTFADTTALQLGQTVISLSGRNRTNVAMGIISEVLYDGDGQTREEAALTGVETNIDSANLMPGSPLINIFGELVGIYAGDGSAQSTGRYTPANLFAAQVKEHQAAASATGN